MKSKHDMDDIALYLDNIDDLCDGLDEILDYSIGISDEMGHDVVSNLVTNRIAQKSLVYDISPYVFESESKFISYSARKLKTEIQTFFTGIFNIMRLYDRI